MGRNISRRLTSVLVLHSLLWLSCSSSPPRGQSEQEGPFRIRYSAGPAGGVGILDVARERGLLERENLEIEFLHGDQHYQPIMDRLEDATADMAQNASSNALIRIEQGIDMVIFMGGRMGVSNVLLAQPELKGYNDLKGKKIGCSGLTGQDCFIMRRMMARNGIKESEFEIVYGFNTMARYYALQNREIDATIFSSPARMDPKDNFTQVDHAPKYVPKKFQFSVAMARRSWAEANRDTLVRFIRVYVETLDWISQPENKTAAVELIARLGGMDITAAEQRLINLINRHNPKARIDMEGLQAVMENLAEFGVLPQPIPPIEKYVDLSYYREAVRE